ncbi:Uncharacterised protein r2_g1607 [Pycnogonum litorale]
MIRPKQSRIIILIVVASIWLVTFCLHLALLCRRNVSYSPKCENLSKVRKDPSVQKKNVMFLKTHKCGSTSVQNVIIRKAYKSNLKIGIVKGLNLTMPFVSDMLLFKNRKYNVICQHLVFNENEIEAAMEPNPLYVSIVRDPATQFESLYHYLNMIGVLNMNLSTFVSSRHTNVRLGEHNIGANMVSYVFGIPIHEMNNSESIRSRIKEIERKFDLIMIHEHFDESLILLRHLLHWDIDDMVTFKLNERMTRTYITESLANQIRAVNMADQMIYEHFYKIFQQKAKDFGNEKLEREVSVLRQRVKWWMEYCLEGIYDDPSKLPLSNRMQRGNVKGYKMRKTLVDNDCEFMTKSEIALAWEWERRERIKEMINSKG